MEDTIKGCLNSCGMNAEKIGGIAGSLVEDGVKKCMGGSDNGGKKEDKDDKEEKEEKKEGGGGGGEEGVMGMVKSFF